MVEAPHLVFAIGDVHGRADLLESLLEAISEYARHNSRSYRVVFLGDIIDRGPNSRKAMELVCKTLKQFDESRLILGNHDEFLLRVLNPQQEHRDRVLAHWRKQGGEQTLYSYGFLGYEKADLIAEELQDRFPEHIAALRVAEDIVIEGEYAFVHAGVRPGLPLSAQSGKDLRWIREGFLEHDGPFEKIIIHGHTVTKSHRPEVYPNRIAIDTGAYATGFLTAAVIDLGDAKPVRFLVGSISNTGFQVDEVNAENETVKKLGTPSLELLSI
ncbi:metallophosphoesterase [Mesorhizobium sp. ANAO-SY3R2]|uniref:metallophosphoesterase n=1 Tax=Mesorhizobium sp. ANAO-SY3R2 TaxID=3166644 RepID=UPI00366BE41A